ncbi:MAG: ArdC family protein [Prevotella sp.]|nr:ArdC family protein [Prevotella sp.]
MGKTYEYDPKKAAEDRKTELKDITEKLEKGVQEVFNSEQFQNLLDTMAKFPHYSVNNNILIMMQKPDATLVQSYTGWKKMGRFVKKGEKGIRILAPAPFKLEKEQEKLDEAGKVILDKDGEAVKEKVEINLTAFKPVSTFDISQTEGEPLPSIGVDELTGSVEGYQTFFEAIKAASPVPIGFEDIKSGAKGYFHVEDNRIAINKGMSEIQTVKTAIHEMAHAKLHNLEAQKDNKQSKNSKEVEAESVAYTVCQHYGIDTSDYSFAYVATWSQGKEMPELKESLNTIREAAADLITKIDAKVQELTAEKEPISFYVAECGEFHSMGEFHENLTLQQAVDIYKSIPSDRMNGVKTIGFVINDDQILANEYDLVVGNRLNIQEMKDIFPELAAHPQVVKAADEIAKLMPELEGLEKSSMKEKLKEKTKAAKPKRAKSSKRKEEVAI